MKPDLRFLLTVLFVIVTIPPSTARSEVIGPLLEKSTFELGLQWRDLGREFYEASKQTLEGHDYSLVGRYGLTQLATLSWELYAGDQDLHNPETIDTRYYLVGGGLETKIWSGRGVILHTGVHYYELFAFNQDGRNCQKNHHDITAVFLAEKSWFFHEQQIVAWSGPGYFRHDIEKKRSNLSRSCNGDSWYSSYNWGWTAGLNLILWKHYQLYFSAVQVDKFQPRAGIMYRFQD